MKASLESAWTLAVDRSAGPRAQAQAAIWLLQAAQSDEPAVLGVLSHWLGDCGTPASTDRELSIRGQ